MSGALSLLAFANRIKFIAFPTAGYGRRATASSSGSTVQSASASASVSFNPANTITASTVGAGANFSTFISPTGNAWFKGVITAPLWLYFNKVSEVLEPADSGGSVTVSAGGAWVQASSVTASVTAAASCSAATIGEPQTAAATATYEVFGVQSASSPTGGPQGFRLGLIAVNAQANATRV